MSSRLIQIATITGIAATLLLSACGVTTDGVVTGRPDVAGMRAGQSAWVVNGSQMVSSLTVLEGLRSRFPSMHVRANGDCPDVLIRREQFGGPGRPLVYVDGQRAADSCILNMIRAGDVQRIEIYPAGHSGRAGYMTDSNGLILIFTRSAS